jgi:hypothetical protein
MSSSPTVKTPHLGYLINEPFYFNSKKDLFPSIQNRANNDDGINIIPDPRSRDKRSRH